MSAANTVVVGCGNPLAGDDGVGLQVIAELKSRGVPPGVRLIAAGTPGLGVLDFLHGATQAIIVDAVAAGQAPGTVVCCQEKALVDLPCRLSLHSLGIATALVLSRLAEPERLPASIALVGIEVGITASMRTGLSPVVSAAVPQAADAVERLLYGERGA